jgi:hypothetical protein
MRILLGVLMLTLLSVNISCNRSSDKDDSMMERQEDRMDRAGDKIDEGMHDAGRKIEDGTEELDE